MYNLSSTVFLIQVTGIMQEIPVRYGRHNSKQQSWNRSFTAPLDKLSQIPGRCESLRYNRDLRRQSHIQL